MRVPSAEIVRNRLTCFHDGFEGFHVRIRQISHMYTEDVDFCASLRARGRTVLFTPEVEIVHSRGRSGAVDPGATAAAYARSRIAFYDKHHPLWAPVLRLYLRLQGNRF